MAKVIVHQLEGGPAVTETSTYEHPVPGGFFAMAFFLNEDYEPPAPPASSGQFMYFYAC